MKSRDPQALPEPAVLFEDTHLIVVDKPAGLLSQGEKTGDPNLVDWLRQHFGRNYVGLVHRLDRNTSGLMVVAKRTKSAQRLTDALQTGKLFRAYRAWLHGALPAEARWVHYLEKDERTNVSRAHRAPRAGAKESALIVRPLSQSAYEGAPLTLAEFVLETGRSHQIRAQASAEGFPLLGDVKYGGSARERVNREFGRPALHSAQLEFPHPMSGEILRFEAPLPADMAELARSRRE